MIFEDINTRQGNIHLNEKTVFYNVTKDCYLFLLNFIFIKES